MNEMRWDELRSCRGWKYDRWSEEFISALNSRLHVIVVIVRKYVVSGLVDCIEATGVRARKMYIIGLL